LYTGKTLNAIDAQKIGFVNEIIDDGINSRDQLINKINKEIAMYKMVIKTLFKYKNILSSRYVKQF